jgi:hypothetical protein
VKVQVLVLVLLGVCVVVVPVCEYVLLGMKVSVRRVQAGGWPWADRF